MAYESRLTITFGARHIPAPAQWDFVWRAGTSAPTGVPTELAAATLAVGRDLIGSGEVLSRFPEPSWAYRNADRALGFLDLTGFSAVREGLRPPQVSVAVADLVQDQLTGYEFVQWPLCPSHRHPLRPTDVGETAWWVCPATRQPVHRIGELTPGT